jgi:tricarballylate dehydrogenase
VTRSSDVVVIGGGNAALCAALSAADAGARVLLLERAPVSTRGGNSYFTAGAFRFPYRDSEDLATLVDDPGLDRPDAIDVGRYTEEDFLADLLRLTQRRADPALARTLMTRAFPTMAWLRTKGVRFVLAYDRQSFLVDGTHRFWGGIAVKAEGEGPELVRSLYRACEQPRIEVRYEARATGLRWEPGARRWSVSVAGDGGETTCTARAVVLACGGFESDPRMRAAYLGPGWDLVKVRGTPYNTGDGIRMALVAGAQAFGHWSGCHAVAWDLHAPAYNEMRLTQHYERDSYPLGIYVNAHGQRFVDEGADFRNFTYARYGQEIIRQPGQVAFQIFDQKVIQSLKKPYTYPDVARVEADTWADLARKAGIDTRGLERTVREYNAAVGGGEFNPAIKDGKAALAVAPPKSNWAQPLDGPPYVCFPVTCGITFTFGGLRITPHAEVVDTEGQVIPGLYACGELVGGLFYHNYPGGTGLMSGAVFGRLAGERAGEAQQS